jgi:hypothetical protein
LRTQWSQLASDIAKQHTECLRVHDNDRNPGNNGCAKAACQHLHSPLDEPDVKKQREDAIKRCDALVADHIRANENARRIDQANRDAQRRAQEARLESIRQLEQSRQRTHDEQQKVLDEMKADMNAVDWNKFWGRVNAATAAAIGGVEVVDGGMQAAGAAPRGTAVRSAADAYAVGKSIGSLSGASGGEQAAAGAASLTGKGLGSKNVEAVGDFLSADAKRRKGDDVGASASAFKGLGKLADAADMGAAGSIIGGAAKIVGGANTAATGFDHIADSTSTYRNIGAQAAANDRMRQQMYDRLRNRQETADRQTFDFIRREMNEPWVSTISDDNGVWGIRADGSVVNARTQQVLRYDPATGRFIRLY